MALRLLAHFYDRNEALIVRGALEAAGVLTFLENFEQIALQPLHEIALGGVRLMVRDEDLSDALAVLSEARRHRVFEGERLSQNKHLAASLLVMMGTGMFLPFRTSRWHDTSEAP